MRDNTEASLFYGQAFQQIDPKVAAADRAARRSIAAKAPENKLYTREFQERT